MKTLFHAVLDIEPITWKRTEGSGKRRYMNAKEREYYYCIYEAMREKGMKPCPKPPVELAIRIEFRYTAGIWRDASNMLKAVEDAGQPSKWADKFKVAVMPDWWDDKQFATVDLRRYRYDKRNEIEITIWEIR